MRQLRKILKEMGVQEERRGSVFDFHTDTFSVTVHQYNGKLYELEKPVGKSSNETSQWCLVDRDTVVSYFKEDLSK